jgi:hypothetical protein
MRRCFLLSFGVLEQRWSYAQFERGKASMAAFKEDRAACSQRRSAQRLISRLGLCHARSHFAATLLIHLATRFRLLQRVDGIFDDL